MKKIIRTISIILILILVFALPCFAGAYSGSLYNGNVNDVSSRFDIYRPNVFGGPTSKRPLDTFNTYNFKISFYLFTSAPVTSEKFHFRSDYEFSIVKFSFVQNVPSSDALLSKLYPYQPSDGSIIKLSDIFDKSLCYVYQVVLQFDKIHYQALVDTTEDNIFNGFYVPWAPMELPDVHAGLCAIYPSQNCFFKGFSIDGDFHAYLIPTQIIYTFNNDFLVPRYEDMETAFNSGDYFYLGFNNSLFKVCYANRKVFNFNSNQLRYPFSTAIRISSSNSSTLYDYTLYNYYYTFPTDTFYLDFSPYYSYDNFIQFKVVSVELNFLSSSRTTSFNTFKSSFGTTEFCSAIVIPCDYDYLFPDTNTGYKMFYESVYKTTSASLMFPTYDFENGDITIDYSQYYLQKENWYDFGKDIYNCFIFLIFNIPLLNNVTAPLFMLLNNFIGVWSALVLPLTTVGLVGAFFLFCFIYKTIKKLIGG